MGIWDKPLEYVIPIKVVTWDEQVIRDLNEFLQEKMDDFNYTQQIEHEAKKERYYMAASWRIFKANEDELYKE